MKVQILPSGSSANRLQYLTSFIVDETVSIDAGCIGLVGEPSDQALVDHILITHTHSDHISSLPMFIENREGNSLQIYGNSFVLETLRHDVFNGRIWPDLLKGDFEGTEKVTLVPLQAENTIRCGGLEITPVAVNHIVPTFGLIVEDEDSTVIFGSDSGPTDRIWELTRNRPNLKATFIESSFPDRLRNHANATGHLTPQLLKTEAAKLPSHVSKVVIHIKPRYHDEVVRDIESLGIESLIIGMGGESYTF